MVFLKASDYQQENKKFRRSKLIMKRVKLPTQLKTRHCSISKCPFPSIHTVKEGTQMFYLCKKHFEQHQNRYEEHKAIFTKALGWFE